jgi:plastocyanin
MRKLRTIQVTLAVAGLLACSGYDASSPYGGGGGSGGGGGGGGGGGNPAGAVTVGSGIQFTSRHNASMNPAVDTIAVGATVTWTWSGTLPHSVKSVGTPSFASSGTLTGSGTYAVTFATAGTYQYECAVHGQAMTGTIVVTPVSSNSRATVATR